MRKTSLLFLVALAVGCEPFGVENETPISYEFQAERPAFSASDTARATFVNQSSRRIYVFHRGCMPEALEKNEGASWQRVQLPILCTMVLRGPLPVRPGGRFEASLLPWMLQDAAIEPGTYRMTLLIGPSEEEATRKVASTSFQITAAAESSGDTSG